MPDEGLRWDVLETHLETAGFLWTAWNEALTSSRYTFGEIAGGPEWRLRTHLDALAAAGSRADAPLLLPALQGDAEASAVAAVVLLGAGRPEPVLEAFRGASDAASRAPLVRALQLRELPPVRAQVESLLRSGDSALAADALEVLSFHRVDLGAELDGPLVSGDPLLFAGALRALVPGLRALPVDRLEVGLRAETPLVRQAALLAGLLAGWAPAFSRCRELAGSPEPDGAVARLALATGGTPDDLATLSALANDAALRLDALWALGFSGRASAAEQCLAWLDDEAAGPVAAEAFSAITGLGISGEYVVPEPGGAGEEPEPSGRRSLDLAPPPDDGLPRAGSTQVERWWARVRKRFEPQARWLRGEPLKPQSIIAMLQTGPARRRAALSFELAVRSRGAAMVETRAFAAVQSAQLERAQTETGRTSFGRPFESWMAR